MVLVTLTAIALCNMIFFYSSVQKELFLEKYTAHIPSYSSQDIVILSKESSDILNLRAFSFPHSEKIKNHKDVLAVSSFATEGGSFLATESDPEMFVISLRKDASVKKWLDTFKGRTEFAALNSSSYKRMYNKAIISKNDALKAHFSLLSLISLFSFIGIIFSTAMLPLMFKKEMWVFILEKLSLSSSILTWGSAFSLVSLGVPFIVFCGSMLLFNQLEILGMVCLHAMIIQVLTTIVISTAILVVGKGEYGTSRVF
jgi:hypothetical protein